MILALDFEGIVSFVVKLIRNRELSEVKRFILSGIDKTRGPEIKSLFIDLYELIELTSEHKLYSLDYNSLCEKIENKACVNSGELNTEMPPIEYLVAWDLMGNVNKVQKAPSFDKITMIGVIISSVRHTVIKNSIIYFSAFSFEPKYVIECIDRLNIGGSKKTIRICNINNHWNKKVLLILQNKGYSVELCIGSAILANLYLRENKIKYKPANISKKIKIIYYKCYPTFAICTVSKHGNISSEEILYGFGTKSFCDYIRVFGKRERWSFLYEINNSDEGLVVLISGPGSKLVISMSYDLERYYYRRINGNIDTSERIVQMGHNIINEGNLVCYKVINNSINISFKN